MLILSVIVPTFNERDNVPILVNKLNQALSGIDFEVIFVDDDSQDGTWQEVERIHSEHPHIRLIRRIGQKGLSSAVIKGALSSQTQFVAVIDADMQHDEKLLPEMLRMAMEGADIVVGSRYLKNSSTSNWETKRLFLSQIALWLTHRIIRHKISDPLSGFFLIRRGILTDKIKQLPGKDMKILLHILRKYRPGTIHIKELPYTFKAREHGKSKWSLLTFIESIQAILSTPNSGIE